MKTLLIFIAAISCRLPVSAIAAEPVADPTRLTLARIFTDKEFEEEKMGTFRWSKIGSYYFALEAPSEGKAGKDLVRHDAETGAKTIIAFAQHMIPAGEKKPLTVDSFEFSPDESQVLLFANTKKVWRRNTRGDYWVVDLASKRLRKLGGDAAASTLMFAKLSPDGAQVAYVRKNNLYVQNLVDLSITPLTTDGSDTLINGTSDWLNEEELGIRDGFRWSSDGSHIVFWQFDTKDVKRFWMVNQTDGSYQRFTTFPYPKEGEKNSAIRLGAVSAAGGAVTGANAFTANWVSSTRAKKPRPFAPCCSDSHFSIQSASASGAGAAVAAAGSTPSFVTPNLYRTALAVAPVADRTLYNTIYEERYMGLPKDNAEGYRLGSPITHAAALKGHLLIIHGTGDDNVHYQATEKLINELITHKKPFTVMPYPNRDHSINLSKGTSRHLYELMTNYLREHLPVDGTAP